MKRVWIEYTPEWQPGSLTPWVHGSSATPKVRKPTPWPLPGLGYPTFLVEFDDYTFRFSSLDELDECVAVLGQKLLPSTRTETMRRALPRGAHWLDEMPDWTKPWRYRERAAKFLARARKQFADELDKRLREQPAGQTQRDCRFGAPRLPERGRMLATESRRGECGVQNSE